MFHSNSVFLLSVNFSVAVTLKHSHAGFASAEMSFLVKQLMKSAVGHAATGRSDHGMSSQGSSGGVTHIPVGPSHAATVRTLILRIETCQVAQDRREALKELTDVPEVGKYVTPEQAAVLLDIGKQFVGIDGDVARTVVEVLATITDPNVYDGALREAVLAQIADVPFFIGFLDDSSFWAKYYSVQILQRLEETCTSFVHKQLLSSHGVHAVIDVLNDSSNGGVLRNEGLILLTALTATDQELQTIVAFENGFDSLFQIIHEEGGLFGGVVATDCLSAIVNMLRGNVATQKFFREMGCAKNLVAVLTAVAPTSNDIQAHDKSRAAASEFTASERFCTPLPTTTSLTLHRCLSVIQALLKGGSMNHDDTAVKSGLLHCGLVGPLATVAFAVERVDVSNRVEAMRLLALLLHKSRGCCDAFFASRVPQHWVETWSVGTATWGTLRALFSSADTTVHVACSSIVSSLIESSASSVTVGSFLMKGIAKPASTAVAMPQTDASHCGYLFSAALFGCLSGASSSSVYFAAVILQQVLMVPQLTEQLLFVPWEGGAVTFVIGYTKHAVKMIQGKQAELFTIAAFLRPLFTWLMYTSKAASFLLQDDTTFSFFLDLSSHTRDSVHARFLFLALAAAMAIAAPSVSHTKSNLALDSLDKASLMLRFGERTNRGRKLRELLTDIETSPDWTDAPVSGAGAPPSVYDKQMKSLLEDVVKQVSIYFDMATECQSPPQPSIPSASPTSRSPELVAAPHPQPVLRPPSPQQHIVGAEAHDHDNHKHASQTPAGLSDADWNEAQKEAAEAKAQNAALSRELQRLKQQLAERDAAVDQIRQESVSAVAKLEHENTLMQKQLAEVLHSKSLLEAEYLETTSLQSVLEEALQAKEEEARTLASSLSMLESRLHTSLQEATQASELRTLLETASVERDELLILIAEMDEEREIRRAAHEASVISPPRTLTEVDVSPARHNHSDTEG